MRFMGIAIVTSTEDTAKTTYKAKDDEHSANNSHKYSQFIYSPGPLYDVVHVFLEVFLRMLSSKSKRYLDSKLSMLHNLATDEN